MLKKKNCLFAFAIPVIIVCIALISYQCFIGQNTSILLTDMKGQYISLFSYFKDVLTNNQSLFYSFSNGFGGNMFGTFAYYLASPLNLLVVLFSKVNMENFIIVILLLKVGLSGLTMNIFLNNVNPNNKRINLLLSICYALNSFIINYFYNIIWLDSIYMLPLVMLGIKNIVDNKNGLLYFITLSLTIFINYYIGYMVCLFSVLFFIYEILIKYSIKMDKKKVLKISLKFIFESLLSGICCAILLLPAILELQQTVRSFGNLSSNNFNNWLSILDVSGRLFLGSNSADKFLNYYNVNIYCGLIVIILLYFYFINKNINRKNRLLTFIFIFIFTFSFICPYLNYIWHGFNFPQGFANRNSFMLIAFSIYISAKSFSNLNKNISNIHYLIILIFYLINSLLTFLYNDVSNNLFKIYVSCVLFIIIIILLYVLNLKRDTVFQSKIFLMLFLVICAELFFNVSFSFYNGFKELKVEYKDYYNVYLENINKYNNDKFYRIEQDYQFSQLDSFIGNYKSASSFLSTMHSNIQLFANKVGISSKNNSYSYDLYGTEFLDDILGIKYFVSFKNNIKSYKKIDSFSFSKFSGFLYGGKNISYSIFINDNALSLGYIVSKKINNTDDNIIENNFYTQLYYQNLIYKSMLNSDENIFDIVEYSLNDNIVSLDVDKDTTYYIEYRKTLANECTTKLSVNDEEKIYDNSKSANGIVEYRNNNNKVLKYTFSYSGSCVEGNHYSNIWVYKLNDEVLKKGIEKLKQQQLNIETYNNTYIKSSINSLGDDMLFTTIPYDKGWKVYVDGEKVDSYAVLDGFTGIDISKGYHNIEFKYEVPGLKLGIILSGIGVVLSIIYFNFNKLKTVLSKFKVKLHSKKKV